MYKWRRDGNGEQNEFSKWSFFSKLLRHDDSGSIFDCTCRIGESWKTIFIGKIQSLCGQFVRATFIFVLVRNKQIGWSLAPSIRYYCWFYSWHCLCFYCVSFMVRWYLGCPALIWSTTCHDVPLLLIFMLTFLFPVYLRYPHIFHVYAGFPLSIIQKQEDAVRIGSDYMMVEKSLSLPVVG